MMPSLSPEKLKVLAFFLPQFHADQLNEGWWGKGFTEWVNVKSAKPLFEEHHQPRVPEGGYFNYEDAKTIDAHFSEAKAFGIDGFVFYHYWSKGTRLLSKPLDILLETPSIGQGSDFALCWANHAWTRSWKNRSGAMDVLLEQDYEDTAAEMQDHVEFLLRCFADPRYLRKAGRPVMFLYRPEGFPDLALFVDTLTAACEAQLGVKPDISGMVTTWQADWSYLDPLPSCTLAQPATGLYAPADTFNAKGLSKDVLFKPANIVRALPDWVKRMLYPIQDAFFNKVTYLDYEATWSNALAQMDAALGSDRTIHFSSFVDFDNTARYGKRAKIFKGFSPELFEIYFEQAVERARKNEKSGLLLINAWNEWAESMYLQADEAHGNARLEAVQRALIKP